ncbi:MAG: GAF domain-containing protein [Pirellulales bacterium]|nr:GAF domain-containing protein [Pirellulales bacterium]
MFTEKPQLYDDLKAQLAALLSGERDPIANAANMAALVHETLPEVNWVGFYIHRGDELVLGPFLGRPACTRIGPGRGVCGAAAQRRETVVVEDVHVFPGHIACDTASRSEIVVPILADGALWGVLDVDSPIPARFDDADRTGLEALVRVFTSSTNLRE